MRIGHQAKRPWHPRQAAQFIRQHAIAKKNQVSWQRPRPVLFILIGRQDKFRTAAPRRELVGALFARTFFWFKTLARDISSENLANIAPNTTVYQLNMVMVGQRD
jgi:CRISPR/Cas system CMR subunit Cmr6 (Cas7 group RAMP superfamily)